MYCYNSSCKILKIHRQTFFYKHLKFNFDKIYQNIDKLSITLIKKL